MDSKDLTNMVLPASRSEALTARRKMCPRGHSSLELVKRALCDMRRARGFMAPMP